MTKKQTSAKRARHHIPDEVLDKILEQVDDPKELLGADGLFRQLMGRGQNGRNWAWAGRGWARWGGQGNPGAVWATQRRQRCPMHPTRRGPPSLLAQLVTRDTARLERQVDMLSAATGDWPVPVHGTMACPETCEPKDCPLKRDLAEVRRLLRTADAPGGFALPLPALQPATLAG